MKRWVAALGLTGIGFYIAGIIILGILGGKWLDKNVLHTEQPILVIAGLVLGIVAAFYGVYKMLRPFISNKQEKGNS